MQENSCPFCKSTNCIIKLDVSDHILLIDCPTCGKFSIDDISNAEFHQQPKDPIISGILRNSFSINPLLIHTENIDSIKDSHRIPKTVPEKIDHLLLTLNYMTMFGGHYLELITDADYPLAYCSNMEEFEFLLDYLADQGFIHRRGFEKGSFSQQFYITYKGFERVEELNKIGVNGDQCFVAMSFDPSLKSAYTDGIREAIISAEYKPMRVDHEEYIDRIDDKIIAEIRSSSLLVADFTQHKNGVYFEAGFAMGLNIPIIWTCGKEHINDLHFDIRQYNCIDWETIDELKERLYNRIMAIGKPSS